MTSPPRSSAGSRAPTTGGTETTCTRQFDIEVVALEKKSNTGRVYKAAQLILHSSPMLHHPHAG